MPVASGACGMAHPNHPRPPHPNSRPFHQKRRAGRLQIRRKPITPKPAQRRRPAIQPRPQRVPVPPCRVLDDVFDGLTAPDTISVSVVRKKLLFAARLRHPWILRGVGRRFHEVPALLMPPRIANRGRTPAPRCTRRPCRNGMILDPPLHRQSLVRLAIDHAGQQSHHRQRKPPP